MVWLFVLAAAVVVFAVAAVTVGREAFRLGHQPPPTIFDLDEAVAYVADDLPREAQARLTYEEVRLLVLAEIEHLQAKGVVGLLGEEPELAQPPRPEAGNGAPVVVADDDALAVVLGEAEEAGIEVDDDDVYQVVTSLHRYLADIGAVGPTA